MNSCERRIVEYCKSEPQPIGAIANHLGISNIHGLKAVLNDMVEKGHIIPRAQGYLKNYFQGSQQISA